MEHKMDNLTGNKNVQFNRNKIRLDIYDIIFSHIDRARFSLRITIV